MLASWSAIQSQAIPTPGLARQNNSYEIAWGSILGGRKGLELEDIAALRDRLCPNRPVPWTEEELDKENLLGPQNDFGGNLAYEYAKFLL